MDAYSQYQENQIMAASQEQILLMLYDGAIRFTRRAMAGLDNNDLTEFHKGIKNSLAIITEFSNSLNHTIGGEIAANLDALYDFMIRELTQANLHKDMAKLRVVETLLMDLRATWGEAVEINKQENAQAIRPVAIPKPPSQIALSEGFTPAAIPRPPSQAVLSEGYTSFKRPAAIPRPPLKDSLPEGYVPLSISR